MIHANGKKTLAALIALVGLAAAGTPAQAGVSMIEQFNFANFNSVANLQLNGVAQQSAGLTGEQNTLSITPPTGPGSVGTAYYNTRQDVSGGFTTDFSFRMRDKVGVGSDGLAFIIQNQGVTAMGASGGAIGFATNPMFPSAGTGIANSVAIVFDTWDNSSNWLTIPGASVVTVQTNGLLPNLPSSDKSLGGIAATGAFNDGAIHNVRITYTPGSMSIFYNNFSSAILSNIPVNLDTTMALTNGDAFVGFTAATGALVNRQRHEILSWSFSNSTQIPAPAAATLLGLGGLIAARRRRDR